MYVFIRSNVSFLVNSCFYPYYPINYYIGTCTAHTYRFAISTISYKLLNRIIQSIEHTRTHEQTYAQQTSSVALHGIYLVIHLLFK